MHRMSNVSFAIAPNRLLWRIGRALLYACAYWSIDGDALSTRASGNAIIGSPCNYKHILKAD